MLSSSKQNIFFKPLIMLIENFLKLETLGYNLFSVILCNTSVPLNRIENQQHGLSFVMENYAEPPQKTVEGAEQIDYREYKELIFF